jgi:hypothetical protein
MYALHVVMSMNQRFRTPPRKKMKRETYAGRNKFTFGLALTRAGGTSGRPANSWAIWVEDIYRPERLQTIERQLTRLKKKRAY